MRIQFPNNNDNNEELSEDGFNINDEFTTTSNYTTTVQVNNNIINNYESRLSLLEEGAIESNALRKLLISTNDIKTTLFGKIDRRFRKVFELILEKRGEYWIDKPCEPDGNSCFIVSLVWYSRTLA